MLAGCGPSTEDLELQERWASWPKYPFTRENMKRISVYGRAE